MLVKFFKTSLFIALFGLFFLISSPCVKAACNCYCNYSNGTKAYVGFADNCSYFWCQTEDSGSTVTPSCETYTTPGPGGNTSPTSGTVKLDDPLGGVTPQQLIGKVISAALGLVGSLALAMFIFGGFLWMTAAGSPDKVKKGRDVMIWAVLGLIIIFSSYTLVNFVLNNVIAGKVK